MVSVEEKINDLIVIKRNGRRVNFDGSKIAIAIKKDLIVLFIMMKMLMMLRNTPIMM